MPTANLSFAKIVATPTNSAWSQAYNAGGLFIALSLSTEDEESQEELPHLGKKLLDTIEAEYFGLEKKDLSSIQVVITQSIADLSTQIIPSLSITSIKDDILYGFLIGSGRLTLKRGEKIGVILENTELETENNRTIKSASGYLQNDDIILIQTAQFANNVPAKIIMPALEYNLPSDIAETITPYVHGKTDGGATAIVLCYKGFAHEPIDELLPVDAAVTAEQAPPTPIHVLRDNSDSGPSESERPNLITKIIGYIPRPQLSLPTINRRKKTILAVALILVGILIASIFYVQSSSNSSKNQLLFNEIYTSAKKSYDEGEGLLSLNKSLARDDYETAKAELDKARGVFTPGSQEQQKLDELTTLVDKRLSELEGTSKITAKEVPGDDQPSLQALAKDTSLLASIADEGTTYTISSKTIMSISDTETKKELLKNDSTWSNPVSLGAFSGNIYVLDTKEGLLKFVPTSSTYEQSTYFKDEAPKLDTAVSMAIDSSIFILMTDGSVQKFTRGTKDSFSLSDIPKNVSKLTLIYTSADVSNIYLIDAGSNSLLKFDKAGKFQAAFQADIIRNTKAFVVSNDEKSAFLLSGGKIYELSL